MSVRLQTTFALFAAVVAGCSCASSHERDADASRDAATGDDARYPDGAAVPDADCEYIAGFRRCDSQCSRPCNALTGRCVESVGVCAGPRTGSQTGCQFTPDDFGEYCSDGTPCAASLPLATTCSPVLPGGPPRTYCGPCMTVEFCLAARGEGLPPFECVWSDGTHVVTGPPPGECPTSPDPVEPFCGGACGVVDCQALSTATFGISGACIGVSDTRGFGVCELASSRCTEAGVRSTLDLCAHQTGRECACLTPSPLATSTTTPFGFPVFRSVCLAYRDHFPANADCMDGTWTSIP